MKNVKFILKHASILFAIAFLCSLILILCNNLTENRIAELKEKTEIEAQAEVLPDAYTFESADAKSFENSVVRNILIGKSKDGKTVGYCVKAEPSGFGGKISMMVGITQDFKVNGVKITSMSETPGLGAKADETWLKQFVKKGENISVVKGGNAGENDVNAISGATITSKAVTVGVNAAINSAKTLSKARADEIGK